MMEHTLRALFEWEGTWKKPFLASNSKTYEEVIDYMMCCLEPGQDFPDIDEITTEQVTDFMGYLNLKPTATKVSNIDGGSSSTYISAELLYASMTIAGVSWEAQDWNLNRLQTLLEVIHSMQSEKKPMPKEQVLQSNKELNKARKQKYNSKG